MTKLVVVGNAFMNGATVVAPTDDTTQCGAATLYAAENVIVHVSAPVAVICPDESKDDPSIEHPAPDMLGVVV